MIRKNQDPRVTQKFGTQQLAKAYRDVDIKDRDRAPYEVEVQVITLATSGLRQSPGEIFVELGMTIRRASPFVCTGIGELANGSIGYIPNRVAYPQGAYEVLSPESQPAQAKSWSTQPWNCCERTIVKQRSE